MKTMIVGEVGSNWRTLDDMLKSADVLRKLGAIPKAQAWHTDHLCNKDRDPKQYAALKQFEIPEKWYRPLANAGYFFSVFCVDMVDFLEAEIKPSRYKIAKPDSFFKPLIQRVMNTEAEIIISTDKPIPEAVCLHCISQYPPDSAYLGSFDLSFQAGISDHTTSTRVPALAVAMGATVIEKHFKLWDMDTPDEPHSLNPQDFSAMLHNIREAEWHLKKRDYLPEEDENMRKAMRGKDGLRPL